MLKVCVAVKTVLLAPTVILQVYVCSGLLPPPAFRATKSALDSVRVAAWVLPAVRVPEFLLRVILAVLVVVQSTFVWVRTSLTAQLIVWVSTV